MKPLPEHLTRPGWDSYQAKPVREQAWAQAQLFAEVLARLGAEGAAVVPCSDGRVQVEFHRSGVELEVICGANIVQVEFIVLHSE